MTSNVLFTIIARGEWGSGLPI